MSKDSQPAKGRKETQRFTNDVRASDLIEGDRVSRDLVAKHPDQLGDPIRQQALYEDEPLPETQLVVATEIKRYHDVYSAILVDVEEGKFIRASRHDRQQAMTQAEADWGVREIGSKVVVDEVGELERPEGERDEREKEYVQTWVEILFDEFAAGHFDLHDERYLIGTTLMLRDFDGRKCSCDIHLEE